MDKDTKQMDTATEGVIYHLQHHRAGLKSKGNVTIGNEYTERFFERVKQELIRRGIANLASFPDVNMKGNSVLYSPDWSLWRDVRRADTSWEVY